MGSIEDYDRFFVDEDTCSPEVIEQLHSTCQPTIDEIQKQQICVDITTRQTLKSKFEITPENMEYGRQLGEGTYGAVYELKNKPDFIVKQFKHFIDEDGNVDSTSLNELSALRAFNNTKGFLHMNNVYFKEKPGETNKLFQIIPEVIMPKYEMTLEQYKVTHFPRLSKEEQIDTLTHIAFKILTTYSQMVRKKILHLDLKPANILLNMVDGKIDIDSMVIADFGLSFYEGSSIIRDRYGYSDYCIQTLSYLSPEVHFGHMYGYDRGVIHLKEDTYVTQKTDMFSIGKILYEFYHHVKDTDSQELTNLYNSMRSLRYNSIKDYIKMMELLGVPELWKNKELKAELQRQYNRKEGETSNDAINRLKDDNYRYFKTSMSMLYLINRISEGPMNYDFPNGVMFSKTEFDSEKEESLYELIKSLMKLCPYERMNITSALRHPLFVYQRNFEDDRLNAILQYIHSVPINDFDQLFSRIHVPALHNNLCGKLEDSPDKKQAEDYMKILFSWLIETENHYMNRMMVHYLTAYRTFFMKEYKTYKKFVNSSSKIQPDAIGLHMILNNTYDFPLHEYEFITQVTDYSIEPIDARKLIAHILNVMDLNLYFVTPYDIWNLYDLSLSDYLLCEHLYILTMSSVSYTINTLDVQTVAHSIARIVLKYKDSSVVYTEQEQELFNIWKNITRSWEDLSTIVREVVSSETRLYNKEVVRASKPIHENPMVFNIMRIMKMNMTGSGKRNTASRPKPTMKKTRKGRKVRNQRGKKTRKSFNH